MTSTTASKSSPRETVAGLMAAGAIFLGAFELLYRPFRLAPAALVLLMIATIMSTEQQRLIKIGFLVVGICFILGATLQIITHHPLF